MPPTCAKNGLEIIEPPPELQNLTLIELQLIQKSMPFLKLRERPITQMTSINDRVINIPISDDDLIKNASVLPRPKGELGLIDVKLKRQMKLKTWHRIERIRPSKINAALRVLKAIHPEYADIPIEMLDESGCKEENGELWKEIELPEYEAEEDDKEPALESSNDSMSTSSSNSSIQDKIHKSPPRESLSPDESTDQHSFETVIGK